MRQLRLRHDIKVKGKLSMNSIKYHLSGSLPLRLTHGRADAGLQAGHGHHGLWVHQGIDYRSQAWSLDPLAVAFNPGHLKSHGWTLGPCIKDLSLITHTLTHYWARRSTELPEITNGQILIILLKLFTNCIFFTERIILHNNVQESGLSHSFACLWHRCGNVLQILKCFAAFKIQRENCSLLLTTTYKP